MKPGETRTPAEWCMLYGKEVVNADGWRNDVFRMPPHQDEPPYPAQSFEIPVTREEFEARSSVSTTSNTNGHLHPDVPPLEDWPDELSEMFAVFKETLYQGAHINDYTERLRMVMMFVARWAYDKGYDDGIGENSYPNWVWQKDFYKDSLPDPYAVYTVADGTIAILWRHRVPIPWLTGAPDENTSVDVKIYREEESNYLRKDQFNFFVDDGNLELYSHLFDMRGFRIEVRRTHVDP